MQAASGYAIELAQAMRQVSLAASAGLSTAEIEGLNSLAYLSFAEFRFENNSNVSVILT